MSRIVFYDQDTKKGEKLAEFLKTKQVEVLVARNAADAVDLLKMEDIAAAVLDIENLCKHKDFTQSLVNRIQQKEDSHLIFIISSSESRFSPLKYSQKIDDVILEPYHVEGLAILLLNKLKNHDKLKVITERAHQIEILKEINSLSYNSNNLEEVANGIVDIIMGTFNCQSALLYLKDENDQMKLFTKRGPIDDSDIKKIYQFTTRVVIEQQKMLNLKDVSRELFWNWARWDKPEHLRSYLSSPISANGEIFGTIELFNLPKTYFDHDSNDSAFFEEIIEASEKVLDLSIKFSLMNQNLEFAVDELSILYEISDALSSTLNLDELLKLIVRKALKSFNSQAASLMMIDHEKSELSIKFAEGLNKEIIEKTRVKIGEGISGRVARSGEPLLLVDVVGIEAAEVEKDVKSALCVPLKIRDNVIGVLNVSKTSNYQFTENDLKLLYNLASLAAQAIEKAALYSDLKDSLSDLKYSYMNTVKALSKAIEAKDPYTQGHVDRVAKYGMAIALEMDPDILKDDMFRYALVLHDIGKIEIPDNILTKPEALTSEEMAVIRRHPETGAKIIQPVSFLKDAAKTIQCHQERWDGKGYPKGLKEDEIPLPARIISVADAFDAITTDRPYRKANTIEHAKKEIEKGAGTQFDPAVVKAFLLALDKKVIP